MNEELRDRLATDLLRDLRSQLARIEARRSWITSAEIPDLEVRLQAATDLEAEQLHVSQVQAAVDGIVRLRRKVGHGPDLPIQIVTPAAPRAPLPVRAARVLARRSMAALNDALWSRRRARAREIMPNKAGPDEPPELSVILPTKNRGRRLIETLDAYRHQTSGLSFEIVVVDDGSTDGSAALVAGQPEVERYSLRLLQQSPAGPAAARNRALEAALGRLVFFTGDDIEPAPDLLLRHWQFHRAADFDPHLAALGLTRWPPRLDINATMRHIDGPGSQQFNYSWLKAGRSYDFRHFYTSNISLHRSMLTEAGGFDASFPDAAFEDAELAYRLSFRGLRIVYLEDALGFHHHPYLAKDFAARQRRCGRMGRILTHLHPELGRWTGSHALDRRRAEILSLGADRWQQLISLSRRLPELKEKAVAVATALDDFDPPRTDEFLAALFHFSVMEGLSEAAGQSEIWLVSLFADSLGPISRRLLPTLNGVAGEAASELARLPEFFSPIGRPQTRPIRKT